MTSPGVPGGTDPRDEGACEHLIGCDGEGCDHDRCGAQRGADLLVSRVREWCRNPDTWVVPVAYLRRALADADREASR